MGIRYYYRIRIAIALIVNTITAILAAAAPSDSSVVVFSQGGNTLTLEVGNSFTISIPAD
ncbi:MAG: hypothetical protein DLM72_09295 [Candidatus Nitrosopolaris wilkensis]|nr:MAG: hypothetical protein DLM72_09295 [Candidatus Nitrosopolaris wilkensis]